MVEKTLKAESPLHGYSQRIGDTQVREIVNLNIVSMAVASGKQSLLDDLLREKIGLSWPRAGTIVRNGDTIALLGLQADQCFMVTRNPDEDQVHASVKPTVTALASLIGNAAYLTDQSDSWAILELEGPSVLQALERICPVDLSATEFDTHSVARTSMEHLSVIVEKPDTDLYRLYSPRSSANSFLHAVTTSLHNIQPPYAD